MEEKILILATQSVGKLQRRNKMATAGITWQKESPASLGGCERAGHTGFLKAALQAFRKPAFLVLIWPILKYTSNSIFVLKLNVWIMTLPACVQLYVAICVCITMQL